MARIWTNDEIEYLKTWAGKSTIRVIANNLYISPNEVSRKVRELSLPVAPGGRGRKTIVPPPFTGERAPRRLGRRGRPSGVSLYEYVKQILRENSNYGVYDVCLALEDEGGVDLDNHTTKQVEQAMERARKRLGLSA